MPKNSSSRKSRRNRARRTGITHSQSDFAWLCKRKPERIGIIAEGDSWFSYPGKHPGISRDINVLRHIADSISATDTANMLRLSANGDEASEMISGKQKHKLAEILKKNRASINLILFSGGGNDIVGKWDMERLLKPYKHGFTAKQCIRKDRLKRKINRIRLAYQELIELRDEYAPQATIVTHTYDFAKPGAKGASFYWGLYKTKPWIYPYLKAKNIPDELHFDIIELMLVSLQDCLLALANKKQNHKKLIVTITQGTLRPGHKSDWADEIHPSKAGFKRIAALIYDEMRAVESSLPVFGGH